MFGRKINKFETRKTKEHKESINKDSEKFLAEVKSHIMNIGSENTHNADKSEFQIEIHSGRTLPEEGSKTVKCVVQSVLVLRDNKVEFGPIVKQDLFLPKNVYVTASKSGKMTLG